MGILSSNNKNVAINGNTGKRSFFSAKKRYGVGWTPVDIRQFDEDEKSEINKAVVVTSEYGLSCCFIMKSGELVYQPMSRDSQKTAGEELDINSIKIITLSKPGYDDIERILE